MRVSIVCPVYNTRPEQLKAAVSSALAQTSGDVVEVVLVDDASTNPETVAALAGLDNPGGRITVLRSPHNAGPAAARNIGLSHASGTWIGFLDADDLWPSDKLANAMTLLASRPGTRWIIGDFAHFKGCVQGPTQPGATCFALGDDPGPARLAPALTRSIILDGLHLGTCLIRRDVIPHRPFDPAVTYGEDLLFLAKLSTTVQADRAPNLSYLCRRGGESMMYSAGRLTSRFASGPRAGLRDKQLRAFGREYRWALYDVYKDLAVNNLLNGRPAAAVRFALQALTLDPREIRSFVRFLTFLPLRHTAELARRARSYSRREQVVLPGGDGHTARD